MQWNDNKLPLYSLNEFYLCFVVSNCALLLVILIAIKTAAYLGGFSFERNCVLPQVESKTLKSKLSTTRLISYHIILVDVALFFARFYLQLSCVKEIALFC